MTSICGLGIFVFAMLTVVCLVIGVKIWWVDDPTTEFEDIVRRQRNKWNMVYIVASEISIHTKIPIVDLLERYGQQSPNPERKPGDDQDERS